MKHINGLFEFRLELEASRSSGRAERRNPRVGEMDVTVIDLGHLVYLIAVAHLTWSGVCPLRVQRVGSSRHRLVMSGLCYHELDRKVPEPCLYTWT